MKPGIYYREDYGELFYYDSKTVYIVNPITLRFKICRHCVDVALMGCVYVGELK